MMTEEQARSKWCPMNRASAGDGESNIDNRPVEHVKGDDGGWRLTGLFHQSARCIASDCMAWRWSADAREIEGRALGACGLAGEVS